MTREMTLADDYLLLPVKNDAAKRVLEIRVGEAVPRRLDIAFAEGQPD